MTQTVPTPAMPPLEGTSGMSIQRIAELEAPLATLAATPAPAAEPGTTTSEWKLGIGALAANAVALAVAFGVHLDAQQQQAILAFVASTTSIGGLYALARGIRKAGTPG